jgi:glycosyltransferase involved in cell wall biosynthesis
MPGEGWTAGLYYLRNLFYALKSLSVEAQPELILLVKENTGPEEYSEIVPFVSRVLHQPATPGNQFFMELLTNIGKKIHLTVNKENPISSYLRMNGVDIFFALGNPPQNFLLPFFSWIPDFQHLYYPELFSKREIVNRNISFECSARHATRVILSSNNALLDFEQFAPWAVEKARVLAFVAQIPSDIYQQSCQEICKKYHIPERFILLPNQFWKHKNYDTVIRALQTAVHSEPKLTIVCTGNTNEYRDISYFSKLLCSISTAGIRDRMIILGLVPRNDLFLLMRQSLAILQPSLFEGWNTTVEEVKSLGKKMIISDIPVHREQDPYFAEYFQPTNAHALATSLLDNFANGCPGPDLELERIAKDNLLRRTNQYGKNFLEIIKEITNKYE